jgi:hypothetical protein
MSRASSRRHKELRLASRLDDESRSTAGEERNANGASAEWLVKHPALRATRTSTRPDPVGVTFSDIGLEFWSL